MSSERPAAAATRGPVVLLPCHTLDEFPTWIGDREADDLLAAWTAAWHPRLVAVAGRPRWASVDLPLPEDVRLAIVPATWDDRFAAQFDASAGVPALVRATRGADAIASAALAAADAPADGGAAERWLDDFQALGLAVLLAELLARRMRTEPDFDSTGLGPAVAAAASAAVEGRDDDVRAAITECYGCLAASRARYYPVDAWLVDLVLLAESTPAALVRQELAAPVPVGIVADPRVAEALAIRDAETLALLRSRLTDGAATLCSGPLGDRPLDCLLPEEMLDSFTAGAAAWEAAGLRPTVFARRSGGGSALVPTVLSGLGYAGAVWSTFDGTPLPDPGAGRILWEGSGGAAIDAVARPPLDARSAAALLAFPERLGDAMDHDHVAVVTFAHHAGTACRWHALLRRIGGWSTALGTFVSPAELFARTAGAGTLVAFGPDAFPPSRPPEHAADGTAAITAAVTAAEAAARGSVARAADIAPLCPTPAIDAAPVGQTGGLARGLAGWWAGARRADADLVLESPSVRVEVHADTGGIRSLRRPAGGSNRLSQQLAVWRSEGHGRMRAEAVTRGTTASGAAGIVSRGLLLDVDGSEAGSFVQGVSLVPGQPLVAVDVEVVLHRAAGGLAGHHAACRFAWHENEDVTIRRGIHAQAVVTERTRFTAPHFIVIEPAARRGVAAEAVTILTGGLPWHVRSSPHVLDAILAGDAVPARRRLAVGVGVERPWDAALEFLAGAAPGSGPRPGPANLRVVVLDLERDGGRVTRARMGLIESAGTAGRVRVEWARDVRAAAARGLDGRPRPDAAVAIEGRAIVVFLKAHEWLVVDLEFAA